jgi:hypothetical protein
LLLGPVTTTVITTIITTRKRLFALLSTSVWAAAVVSLSLIAFGAAVKTC